MKLSADKGLVTVTAGGQNVEFHITESAIWSLRRKSPLKWFSMEWSTLMETFDEVMP
jgi:hypothetical protein